MFDWPFSGGRLRSSFPRLVLLPNICIRGWNWAALASTLKTALRDAFSRPERPRNSSAPASPVVSRLVATHADRDLLAPRTSAMVLRVAVLGLVVAACSAARSRPPADASTSASLRSSGATSVGVTATAAHPNGAVAPSDEQSLGAAGVLERRAFVREVLRRNPSVQSAQSSFRAALARTRAAGAFEDPMVEVGVAPLSIGSTQASFGYEVAVSQKLPWFGKRALEQTAASAEAAAAKADYEGVRRELALTAVALYDRYFVAARSVAINEQHLALMESLRAAAAAQFASGRGSAADALAAEVELAHLEHDAVMLATERDVTVAQMNELLRRSPELSLPPPVAQLPVASVPDVPGPSLQAEALEHRPDIVAVRERARAEVARGERAEREAYPDFMLSTSYNSMWDMPEHRWMVGLGFNVPIQRGRRAAAVDEAHALRAELENEALRLTDAARTQVFVAQKKLAEASHVLELYERRLLPVARRQIDVARAGFASSLGPFAAVLDAERNLRRVELDYETLRADYGVRRAELDRALGRIPALDWKEGAE